MLRIFYHNVFVPFFFKEKMRMPVLKGCEIRDQVSPGLTTGLARGSMSMG